MKNSSLIFLAVLAGLCASLAIVSQSKAQSVNFLNVMPFSSPSGRLGFFDQNTGKIFIYDPDAKECVFKGQLTELGRTIEHLEKKNYSGPTSTTTKGQIRIERGIMPQ